MQLLFLSKAKKEEKEKMERTTGEKGIKFIVTLLGLRKLNSRENILQFHILQTQRNTDQSHNKTIFNIIMTEKKRLLIDTK